MLASEKKSESPVKIHENRRWPNVYDKKFWLTQAFRR